MESMAAYRPGGRQSRSDGVRWGCDTPMGAGRLRRLGRRSDHGGSYTSPDHAGGAMPAEPSSPIAPEIGHLLALTETFADDRSDVLAVLARIADPRKRRGVRHRL